jgi:pseudouridine kinase
VDANLPENTLKTIMSQASRAKLPVFADPASTSLAARLEPYFSQLSMLIPNSAEAAYYCQAEIDVADQRNSVETAKCWVAKGVDLAIITLAEAGVCYATSETSGYIRTIQTDIADPTGAGDALSAALIFALMNDIPLDDAVRLGVAAASLTLRHPGAVLEDLSLEMLYNQL